MISRWIERFLAWRTRRRFRRWHRRYGKRAANPAWPGQEATAGGWEAPPRVKYDRSEFERNVAVNGAVPPLEFRFDEEAVRALIRIIRDHPAAAVRREHAAVDEYIYSMF